MYEEITAQARQAVTELVDAAGLRAGELLVIGCSSSEMVGARIGKGSSMEAAQAALDGVGDSLETGGDTATGDAKTVGENLSTGIGNGITEKESVALAAAQTTVNNVAAVLGQLNSMVFSPTVSIGSPFTRGLYDLPMPSGGSTKGADKAGAQSLAVSVNVDGKAMAKAVFPHIDTLQGTAAARNNA